MTDSNAIDDLNGGQAGRRARVVILGEFSAGKSTLINLFTGAESLRTQITATQMPAVWMSYGSGDPYRVDLDGNEHPVDPSNPESISVDDTAYVRTFLKTPALQYCDFIDTPGNSDPNIASIAWERVAQIADVAVWCSSSTQAWRQSELSAWRDVPAAVRARSILLMTRADKLTSDIDREKVFKRVEHETSELFTHVHMASLLKFENTRPVLRDLLTLCNTVEGTNTHDVDAAIEVVGGLSDGTSVTRTETLQKSETVRDNPTDKNVAAATETTTTSEEMTDDMLIDSLDLSGEMSIDDFALNGDDDDADMDEVLAALTTPVTIGKRNQTSKLAKTTPAVTPPAPSTPSPIIEEPIIEGYASDLWRKMSDSVPMDDPDAYNVAFDMFLEKIDTKIVMLQRDIAIKAVG